VARLETVLKRQREQREYNAKMNELAKYYAGTSVPVERVASHMGITVEQAEQALRLYGRKL